MGESRDIRKFAGLFMLCFGLLMLPWPFLQQGFASGFQSAAGFLLRITHPTLFYGVGHRQDPLRPSVDTEITLVDRSQVGADGRAPATLVLLDSRSLAWIPNGMVVALWMATPVSWRGRVRGCLVGATVSNFVVAFGVYAAVGSATGTGGGEGWGHAFMAAANEWVVRNTWTAFLVPTLVWVVGASLNKELNWAEVDRAAPLPAQRPRDPLGER